MLVDKLLFETVTCGSVTCAVFVWNVVELVCAVRTGESDPIKIAALPWLVKTNSNKASNGKQSFFIVIK